MQPQWDMIGLSVLLSTGIVLGARCLLWLGWCSHSTPPDENRANGHAFDPSSVTSKLEEVRSDFAGAVCRSHVNSLAHEELLAATRRAVRELAFFRDRRGTT